MSNVKLVSYTVPSEELIESGIEDMTDIISYCARVSNPSNQHNTETAERLINYLIKNAHWSPFELVNVCLEINTTRDIAHQIVRHRSFAFNEFSQRYANVEDLEDAFVIREARLQDTKNRQNSVETDDYLLKSKWEDLQDRVIREAREAYSWAIENGIAKEQARAVLPEGCTKTRLYMNGSIRSWVHYIDLRGANGTQKEHMEIAHACAEVISKVFPMVDNNS